MTQEQLVKHWVVIKAFKFGMTIEFLDKGRGEWREVENPAFNFELEYRIKPESKLVPFSFEDAPSLLGRSVRNKTSGSVSLIIYINKTFIKVPGEITFSYFLDQYVFLNGEPCGKFINE